MKNFRFRAECVADVVHLQDLVDFDIHMITVTPVSAMLPDVEVNITMDSIHLEQLKAYMRLVDDSHVMVQTLAPYSEYNGERDYNID